MTIPPLSILGNLQPQQTQGAAASFGAAASGGLSDLFSLFFGAAQSAEDMFNDVIETANVSTLSDTVLTGLEGFDSDIAYNDLLNNGSPTTADTDVLAMVQKLEGVLSELQNAGIEPGDISSVDELAKAYETLGLSPEDALAKAQGVDAAIKLVAKNNDGLQDYLSLANQEIFDNPAIDAPELISHVKMQQSMAAFSQAVAIAPQDDGLLARVKDGLPLVQDVVPLKEKVEAVETVENLEKVVETHKDIAVKTVQAVATPVQAMKEAAATLEEVRVESKSKEASRVAAAPQTIYKLQPTSTGDVVFSSVENRLGAVDDTLSDGDALDVDVEAEIARQVQRATVTGSKLADVAAKSDVAQQVQNQIKILAGKNGGEVKLTLNPAELGEIKIKLDIKNGHVSGKIIVQTPEALEQLARDLRVLQQGLADAGLELAQNGIDFQLSSHQQGQQELADGGTTKQAQADIVEEEVTAEWKNVDKLVDVRV